MKVFIFIANIHRSKINNANFNTQQKNPSEVCHDHYNIK